MSHRKTSHRRSTRCLIIALFHLGSLSILLPAPAPAGESAGPAHLPVGKLAPPFTMRTMNAEESGFRFLNLSDFVGESPRKPRKAVIVSFFATWCEPCKRELPFLQKIYELYEPAGLQVIVINIEQGAGALAKVKELLKKHRVTFPVIKDGFKILAKRYKANTLPCLYVLDGTGRISIANSGYNKDISKSLLKMVQQMLADDSPKPEEAK